MLAPSSFPSPNVIVPAIAPIVSIRAPLPHPERPVNRLIVAPTANSVAAVNPITQPSVDPPRKMNRYGTSGTAAPAANAQNDEIAAPHGDPSSAGFNPSSSRPSLSRAL